MTDAERLKTKLDEWNNRFAGQDPHSIRNQIAHMLWRSAFYRSINESRRFLPKGADGQEISNGPLHELIDEGYLTMTSLWIRRLLDRGAATGARGVVSLYGLIRDIAAHANLLTRANVLEARGLPYHYEPIKQKAREEAWARQRNERSKGTFVPRTGWSLAEYWHGITDKLCRVTPESRTPGDMPDWNKFQHLLKGLEDSDEGVKNWTDKFIAHASTLESRQTLDPEDRALSLAKIWRAEQAIVKAAGFISLYFLDGTSFGGVPAPQFDQFEHLDQPFVSTGAHQAMEQAWNEHSDTIEACSEWFWDKPLLAPLEA